MDATWFLLVHPKLHSLSASRGAHNPAETLTQWGGVDSDGVSRSIIQPMSRCNLIQSLRCLLCRVQAQNVRKTISCNTLSRGIRQTAEPNSIRTNNNARNTRSLHVFDFVILKFLITSLYSTMLHV